MLRYQPELFPPILYKNISAEHNCHQHYQQYEEDYTNYYGKQHHSTSGIIYLKVLFGLFYAYNFIKVDVINVSVLNVILGQAMLSPQDRVYYTELVIFTSIQIWAILINWSI